MELRHTHLFNRFNKCIDPLKHIFNVTRIASNSLQFRTKNVVEFFNNLKQVKCE
jgi:hypothetical protein